MLLNLICETQFWVAGGNKDKLIKKKKKNLIANLCKYVIKKPIAYISLFFTYVRKIKIIFFKDFPSNFNKI
jgi:hypothetical protein